MANFIPTQINLSNINGGVEYQDGDGLQPSMPNGVVEGIAYCDEQIQALVQSPDNTDASTVGTPTVSFVETTVNGRTYKKFKFSNLKGEKGSDTTIVQTTGESTTSVMSQKAVTDSLDTKANKSIIITTTIPNTEWGAINDETKSPFEFYVVFYVPELETNGTLELVNNDPVLYANYGFQIAEIDTTSYASPAVKIWATDKPTTDVTLTCEVINNG